MFKPIPVQHYGAGKKKKIIWHNIKCQDSRLSNIPFLKSYFDLLIFQLPDIAQKSFCTSDGAINLTFQMNYVPVVYHVAQV